MSTPAAKMLVSHLIRFRVKYMAGCLFRHNCTVKTIAWPNFRTGQICWYMTNSSTRLACNSDAFCTVGNYALFRTRALCSDTIPTVKTKRGRKATVPKEETKQYLTSLGLDCDLIQKSSPLVLREDVSKIESHVALMQRLHLSDTEILDILRKTPELLKVDTSSIQEHIKFLQDLEVEGLLILNIFQRVPKFFATPLPRIKVNVEYIQSLNLTNQNIRILLKYAPSLFYRRKDGVKIAGEGLRRVLLEHDPTCNLETSLKYMIRTDPLLFGRSVTEIEDHVEHLKSLGFTGLSLAKIIRFCPSVLRIGTEFITDRLKLVQERLSLSDEESLNIVMRLPKILHASNKTIDTKVDFLFKKGFKAVDIYRAPRVLNASMQRIESRLQKLSELKYRPNSLSIMQQSEGWFEDFLVQLRHKQQVKEDKAKHSSEEQSQEHKY